MSLLEKFQSLMFVIPGGGGKSRIAAAIAIILANSQSPFSHVHLVFPNETLKRKDEPMFEQYEQYCQNVTIHVGIDGLEVTPDAVAIFDEGEAPLFEQTAAFSKLKCRKIILSVTTAEAIGGFEQSILDHEGFQVFDETLDKEIPAFTGVGLPNRREIYDYLQDQLRNSPVLLYCDNQMRDTIRQMNNLMDITYITANVDHDTLQDGSLDTRNPHGYFTLLIAYTEVAMRGIDYRAPKNGLLLFVQKPFSHNR